MSNTEDRIAVPTNGHRPPLSSDSPAPSEASPETGAPSMDELRVAFTPGQVAAGFGIIAALILLVVGRRRGKRG